MALWSGRFSSDQNKNVKLFSESISFDKRLYKYDIIGSKAHVAMLADCGIIPRTTSKKIINGLDKIEKKIDSGNFTFSPDLEDIHMHIENELIRALGDEGARLHTARSRNDQIALDIRLYLRDEISCLETGFKNLQKSLVGQADSNAETIMPGFTHLQHAQPILFAHHMLAYTEMLERDIGRLQDCKKRLNVMPLGSGAISGTTLPINRAKTAELLGFPEISRNSMDAVADRDFACEFLSALAIFAMHISRLSEDVILWASPEFGFVELDDAFCTGSSLMPQKKNPDIAELSRGKTGRIYGSLVTLLTLCKGLPMSYNRDLQEDKEPIFDALDSVEKILSVYPGMIKSMKIKREKMLAAASEPELMATDLAEYLVKKGVPFRKAHSKIGELIKWCGENSIPLNKLSIREMKAVIPEADGKCLEMFSPEKSVSLKEITGGTGFREVRKQINYWKKKLK